jgi:hypothetical protein
VPNHQQLGADRAVVEQAAAHLRHQAILAGYAGIEGKHFASALALILDEVGRHIATSTTISAPASPAVRRWCRTPGRRCWWRPRDGAG